MRRGTAEKVDGVGSRKVPRPVFRTRSDVFSMISRNVSVYTGEALTTGCSGEKAAAQGRNRCEGR